ncbi:hypothetical protein NE237_012343 [Protea cynaroides]|uniref:Uncharacterized protein n=1 Tax=Protea cynaroides TaxID=273540 RepID=A0A9Q0GXW6_9MAGN|nr:hypothetical protein NE237_012343 [Protea cynaroides]
METVDLTRGLKKKSHAGHTKETTGKKSTSKGAGQEGRKEADKSKAKVFQVNFLVDEGDSIFKSTRLARALVEESRLPRDIKHVEDWMDREAIQRCYWYKKMNAEGELRQAAEKLCKAEGDLKSIEEWVQLATFDGNKAKESLQGLKEWEKLYRKEVITEYRQFEEYKQALKDVANSYFRECSLCMWSCLDEQGMVVDYSTCLSLVEEADHLGGTFIEELEGGAEGDHSPDLPMFAAPP